MSKKIYVLILVLIMYISSEWTTVKSMFIWGGYIAIAGILVLSFITYPLASLLV